MNWDQIESKWAAMANRVRADLPTSKAEAARQNLRLSLRVITKTSVIVDAQSPTHSSTVSSVPTE